MVVYRYLLAAGGTRPSHTHMMQALVRALLPSNAPLRPHELWTQARIFRSQV